MKFPMINDQQIFTNNRLFSSWTTLASSDAEKLSRLENFIFPLSAEEDLKLLKTFINNPNQQMKRRNWIKSKFWRRPRWNSIT